MRYLIYLKNIILSQIRANNE